MNNKAKRLVAAAILDAVGIYLIIVLINSISLIMPKKVFFLPGVFLYECFLEASFYLPTLFIAGSLLVLFNYFNLKAFVIEFVSLLLFFTLALILKIQNYIPGTPAVDFIITNLNMRGGSLLLGLLLVLEILIIIRVATIKDFSISKERIDALADIFNVNLSENKEDEVPFEIPSVDTDFASTENVNDETEASTHSYEPVPLRLSNEFAEKMRQKNYTYKEEEPAEKSAFEITYPETNIAENDITKMDEYEDISYQGKEKIYINETFNNEADTSSFEEFDSLEKINKQPEVDTDIKENADKSFLLTETENSIMDEEIVRESAVKKQDSDETIERDFSKDDDYLDDSALSIDNNLEYDDEEDEDEEDEDEEDEDEDEEDEEINTDDPIDEDDEELIDEEPIDEETSISSLSDTTEIIDIDPMLSAEPVSNISEESFSAKKISNKAKKRSYSVPIDNLLKDYENSKYWIIDEATKNAGLVLQQTLKEFRIDAEVTGISKGPVITMFEILPAPGVKLSKIVNLADNIALRLAASRVRIVAPIPGKHAVGIEVPNRVRSIVSFKEILESEDIRKSKMAVPVVLGKDITGGARIIDLVQTPHLLIAGATGSGKSVCVNGLISSILYSKTPQEVKMILIDPKIVELKLYNDIPHLLTPVITEPKKAFQALQYAMCEMERRYSLLNALGVRDIHSFNRKVKVNNLATEKLPYIVIIVDEFADLMATTGKELETVISRLAAMSRAVGIHLVLATQRPSVDVITGLIKANIPSRIAFMVASKTDSRIILDAMGADKLLGKGDMLFTSAWDPNPVRIQGAFLGDDEVESVTDYVKTLGEPDYIDDEIFVSEDDDDDFKLESDGGNDPLMDAAVGIVVDAGKASASYLQRRLKIGYNRAARLVEDMEERGIVGPANGSKPRDILHIPDRA